jgi:hypothetical protein
MRKCAVWLIVSTAALTAQIVTKDPNKLGLDIESVTLNTPVDTSTPLRAKVTVHNTSGKPITAYAVNLIVGYSDGEKLSDQGLIDYFTSVGLKQMVPEGPGTDPNMDVIASGASREASFYINKKPESADAQPVNIRVGVAGIIFEDESTVGDSARFDTAARIRDEESTEVAGWCADIRRFSEAPIPRKNFKDMLAAHGLALPIPELQQNAYTAGEGARMEMANLFRMGLQWQSDDTAMLPLSYLNILQAKCTNAEQHLKRRADR